MSRDDVIGERIDPITGVKVSEYAEESQEVAESADLSLIHISEPTRPY